ncbi:hypothetical protein J1N35_020879 [Gossypium stocksii]|uniref:Reverse transcriptase domain-containing protein n=1 Tax=Gossypium stocksii TaxID=47602 RepID=A0A9D3VDK6_9ROSI|nr:hypothetical protein J1N35_020879 [Gossypium stocksii]
MGKRYPHFGNFVDSTDLHDLGSKEPPFTWHRGSLFEHLDRALVVFPSLSLLILVFLEKAVSNEEIKEAMFDMAPLKAPGSDGFHTLFFQKQWDTIGEAVCDWFKYIFPKIIAQEQAGFIAGRNINDNFILAQENGVPLPKFRPVRGIRQGCPLSLYLFVLCIEWLGHSIQSAISKDAMVNLISSTFGFQRVHNLGHYLGAPLLHKRVTSSTLQFVVEKVYGKLHNWKARKLSSGGRITLAQSVLLAIPSYFMQILMIPRKTRDEIKKLIKQFI